MHIPGSWAQPSHHSHKPWHLPKPSGLHPGVSPSRQHYPRAQLQTPGSPEQLHKQTIRYFLKAERGIKPSQSRGDRSTWAGAAPRGKAPIPALPAPTGAKPGLNFARRKAEMLRCVPATLWPPCQAISGQMSPHRLPAAKVKVYSCAFAFPSP